MEGETGRERGLSFFLFVRIYVFGGFIYPLLAFREPLLQLTKRLAPVRDLVLRAFSTWLVISTW